MGLPPRLLDSLGSDIYSLAKKKCKEWFGDTIYEACEKGDLERINELIAEKPDLVREPFVAELEEDGEEVEENGWSPLHFAARGGRQAIAEFLLGKGVDISYEDSSGMTPCHVAAQCGHLSLVQFLLEKGADAQAVSGDQTTLLHYASKGGNPRLINFLVEKGAALERTDDEGFSPLFYAVVSAAPTKTIPALLERGANMEARNEDGFTPLLWAAACGAREALECLLDKGAKRDACDKKGRNALHVACCEGRLATIEALSQRHFDVDAPTTKGATALHLVASSTSVDNARDVILLLAAHGVDARLKNKAGKTAYECVNGAKGLSEEEKENRRQLICSIETGKLKRGSLDRSRWLSRNKTAEQVVDILVKKYGASAKDVFPFMNLKSVAGDDLDVSELARDIEDALGIEIDDADGCETVTDLVSRTERARKAK